MNETLKHILDNNPGLINIILTGVLLPLGILWLTNRNNRQLKQIEKNIELQFKTKDDIREQEKKVYSSLSKILFDVQQLHVSLSGKCVDENCITNSLIRFDAAIGKCHDDIADNMLYLSSDAINLIYKFYNSIGQLKIHLQELDKRNEYEMSNVAVYYASQELAELFISQRAELKLQFDKAKQQMMRYCCGKEPSKELKDRYDALVATMNAQNIALHS
jgi:hypothetical protein